MEEEPVKIEYSTPSVKERLTTSALDVSWGTIVKIMLALATLYFIFLIRNILIWLIFALIISILFNPAINFLQKARIPRILASVLVYAGVFTFLGLFIYVFALLLFSEFQHLSLYLSTYFEQVVPYLDGLRIEALRDFETFSESVSNVLQDLSGDIFIALGAVFGGILSSIAIFSIAFFLSLEEDGLVKTLMLVSPKKYKTKVLTAWDKSQKKIVSWFGVRIACCLFIGLATGIVSYALNIRYAVFFGFFAGIFNIIIVIGPLLSGAAITIFILIVAGPPQAVIFLIAFLIAQQIENNIIMPSLNKRFLNLSPSLVLVSLLIGATLWGVLGAILAVPLIGIFFEFTREFLADKREED